MDIAARALSLTCFLLLLHAAVGGHHRPSDSPAPPPSVVPGVAPDYICLNISGPPEILLPRDMGAHMHYRHELWYFLGKVRDEGAGRTYGVEFSLLRRSRQCGNPLVSTWHLTLTVSDPANQRYLQGVKHELGDHLVTHNSGNTPLNITFRNGRLALSQHPSNPALLRLHGAVARSFAPAGSSIVIDMTLLSAYGTQPMFHNGYSLAVPGNLGAAQIEASHALLAGSISIPDAGIHATLTNGSVYLQHMWQSDSNRIGTHPRSGWDWAWGIVDGGTLSYALGHIRRAPGDYTNTSHVTLIRPHAFNASRCACYDVPVDGPPQAGNGGNGNGHGNNGNGNGHGNNGNGNGNNGNGNGNGGGGGGEPQSAASLVCAGMDDNALEAYCFANRKVENIFVPAEGFTRVPYGDLWTSPRTGLAYPRGHTLRIPALQLEANCTLLVPDNEVYWPNPLVPGTALFVMFEGIGELQGTLAGVPFTGSCGAEDVNVGFLLGM